MRAIYLLCLTLCLSCADTKKLDDHLVFRPTDQIDYYRLTVTEEELKKIVSSENISMEERRVMEILYHKDPLTIADSTFIAEMDEVPHFTKYTLDKKKHDDILKAFAHRTTIFTASLVPVRKLCAPTYKDILVFRHNSRITGIAKLCFDCNESHLVGQPIEPESVQINYNTLQKALAANIGK